MSEYRLMPPIGFEDFKDIRNGKCYYVDKTGMIKELLENQAKVTLFTRPRRFGKTLNMSMLQYFFEIGKDPALFDGLAISRESRLCEEHMGKYPVISITLKEAQGLNFEEAKSRMAATVSYAAADVSDLVDGDQLDEDDRNALAALRRRTGALDDSLNLLSKLLSQHYGRQTVFLIDEYDVPLNAASIYGYYDEMVSLIRAFLGAGLKTNSNLAFAVLTGCLRVAKESIFTGLNNLKVYSVLDDEYDEWFGFTEDEVQKMLAYYGREDLLAATRDWYDGYTFGNVGVYCPWDVVNWLSHSIRATNPRPKNYWANSSGNDIVTKLADMADQTTKAEMERLADGGTVTKNICAELTYRELYDSVENIWTMLLNTGYLTCRHINDDGSLELSIPNREIMNLFQNMLAEWSMKRMKKQESRLTALFDAMNACDAAAVESEICGFLAESISFLDGGNSIYLKEMFYHGILLGLFVACPWVVRSNREAGDGRADIAIWNGDGDIGIIIEVKYAERKGDLEKKSEEALSQIIDKNYADYFMDEEPVTVHRYGMAFYKKRCRVAGQ